jgi:uncharacterized membrane protein YoaT (DUF817 family)
MSALHRMKVSLLLQFQAVSIGILLINLCLFSHSGKGAWGMSRLDWRFMAAALYQVHVLWQGFERCDAALLILVSQALAMRVGSSRSGMDDGSQPELGSR